VTWRLGAYSHLRKVRGKSCIASWLSPESFCPHIRVSSSGGVPKRAYLSLCSSSVAAKAEPPSRPRGDPAPRVGGRDAGVHARATASRPCLAPRAPRLPRWRPVCVGVCASAPKRASPPAGGGALGAPCLRSTRVALTRPHVYPAILAPENPRYPRHGQPAVLGTLLVAGALLPAGSGICPPGRAPPTNPHPRCDLVLVSDLGAVDGAMPRVTSQVLCMRS